MNAQNYFQNSNFKDSCTTSFSIVDTYINAISSVKSINNDVIILVKQDLAVALYQRSENHYFDDDAICFPDSELKRSQDETSSNQLWDISIVPNPATNNLNITWKNSNADNEELTIVLMDLQGKVLSSNIVPRDDENINLDISNHAAGVYLIQGNNSTGIHFIEKVIIK